MQKIYDIMCDIHYSLRKYYEKTRNVDVGLMDMVKEFFKDTAKTIHKYENRYSVPFEYLVGNEFGTKSEAVKVYLRFNELLANIDNWSAEDMWNDYENDKDIEKLLKTWPDKWLEREKEKLFK